jgi:hypothetical protein
MNPLIYAAAGLALSAVAVTIHAVLSADDGYEDDDGFHSITPTPLKAARSTKADEPTSMPPCLPAL